MAVEILRPQELLTDKFSRPTTSFRRLTPANGIIAMKQNQQAKPSHRTDKKRSKAAQAGKKPIHGGAATTDRNRSGGLTMGQVTILKRGEIIPESSPPPQKNVSKKNRFEDERFAGSCISPPSPRSLPLPSFFNRKAVDVNSSTVDEEGATIFLRRVLRLE